MLIGWYLRLAAQAFTLVNVIAAFNVCARSAVQTAAPDAILGRTAATGRLFSRGALPVGGAILMLVLALTPVWLLLSPVGQVSDVAQLGVTATEPVPTQG